MCFKGIFSETASWLRQAGLRHSCTQLLLPHHGGQECSASAEPPLPLHTSEQPNPGGEKVWGTCFELVGAGRAQARLESLPANLLKTLKVNRIKEAASLLEFWELESSCWSSHPNYWCWAALGAGSAPESSESYSLWRVFGGSLLPKGDTVKKKKRVRIYLKSWISILHVILAL